MKFYWNVIIGSLVHKPKPSCCCHHLLNPSTKLRVDQKTQHLLQRIERRYYQWKNESVYFSHPILHTSWPIGLSTRLVSCLCESKISVNRKRQLFAKNSWKPCLVGSRIIQSAESRYAPIEGEALAAAYAIHQTLYYISRSTNLIIATNHEPLVGILNNWCLTSAR